MDEFTNKFWEYHLQLDNKSSKWWNGFIMNGQHYKTDTPYLNKGDNSHLGCGGAEWRIVNSTTGEEIITNDLWYQGEVPVEFISLFPHHAVSLPYQCHAPTVYWGAGNTVENIQYNLNCIKQDINRLQSIQPVSFYESVANETWMQYREYEQAYLELIMSTTWMTRSLSDEIDFAIWEAIG